MSPPSMRDACMCYSTAGEGSWIFSQWKTNERTRVWTRRHYYWFRRRRMRCETTKTKKTNTNTYTDWHRWANMTHWEMSRRRWSFRGGEEIDECEKVTSRYNGCHYHNNTLNSINSVMLDFNKVSNSPPKQFFSRFFFSFIIIRWRAAHVIATIILGYFISRHIFSAFVVSFFSFSICSFFGFNIWISNVFSSLLIFFSLDTHRMAHGTECLWEMGTVF